MITVDFTRAPVRPGAVVLDIGCGSGRHACQIVRTPGVTVIGVDADITTLAEAHQNLRLVKQLGEGPGKSELVVGDITRLPFPNGSFDLVICSEVLEHVPDDDSAIGELTRVLKSGHLLVVSVPRFLPERLCWLLSREYHETAGGHVRIYRQETLAATLRRAGLEQRGFHYAHGLHTPYWWLKCLVGPAREDCAAVKLYHRFLVWDMMKRPWLSRSLERVLNPLVGKSCVLYLKKRSRTSVSVSE